MLVMDTVHAPQPQESLRQLLQITWSAAPPMPQGMQDNDGGLIGNYLVMACGFCHGRDDDWKPGVYPRGFLDKVWALDLKDEDAGWVRLPDFPGAPRQEMQGVSVNDEVYLWGGFSYSAPYAYRDGYKLSRQGEQWVWSELPSLPWPLSCGGICAHGAQIYLFGGADYDGEQFCSLADRTSRITRLGSRLLRFDTRKPGEGWQEVSQCPGTPRVAPGMAAVGDTLYLIGGDLIDPPEACTVVDSWSFVPQTGCWQRLRDLPVSVGGFGSGQILFQDRYLLLAAGYQRPKVRNPDGTTRPAYGIPSRVDRTSWKQHPSLQGVTYFNHVWVYDTSSGLFGTATPLPYDDNAPSSYVVGDTWYLFPGETGGFEWEGEYFGHAPEFVLKGRLELSDRDGMKADDVDGGAAGEGPVGPDVLSLPRRDR